jgi:hypothetical protein
VFASATYTALDVDRRGTSSPPLDCPATSSAASAASSLSCQVVVAVDLVAPCPAASARASRLASASPTPAPRTDSTLGPWPSSATRVGNPFSSAIMAYARAKELVGKTLKFW